MSLPVLRPGQFVLFQCDKSKKWDRLGEIIDVQPDGLSYLVNFEGKVIVRGPAMLKPISQEWGSDQDQGQEEEVEEWELISHSFTHSSPRRFKRLQEKEEAKSTSGHCPVRASAVALSLVPSSCLPRRAPTLQPVWVSWLRMGSPVFPVPSRLPSLQAASTT